MHFVTADDDPTVSVTTSGSCEIFSPAFEAPGNVTVENRDGEIIELNAIGENVTDSFYGSLVNHGNMNATVTADINVTNVSSYYYPGNDKGDYIDLTKQQSAVNESYEPENFNMSWYIPENETTALGNTFEVLLKSFKADYEAGNYVGWLNVNYTCTRYNGTKNFTLYDNFQIVEGKGVGGGSQKGEPETNFPFPSESNTTDNVSSNTTSPDVGGNRTSNLTKPRQANETGNYTSNITTPADANQTGAESNQTVEGDNDNPGKTPEPEPEPEPAPGDSPDPGESDSPRLQIDIEPVNNTYNAQQGQFAPAALEIQNIGERSAENIQLVPEIGSVRPGWNVRNAQISNLSVNETVRRDVFVQPPENQRPGDYLVPVRARNDQQQLDLDYFTVNVVQSEFAPTIGIQEAPESVTVASNSSQTLPILLENTGRRTLTNVSATLQNVEDCGKIQSSPVEELGLNESASLSISMETVSKSQSCNSTLIISSDQGAYAFSNIEFTVTPEGGLIPPSQRAPFIVILWTVVLAGYAVLRKKYDLTSTLVQVPFILLIVGETVILLYMVVNYYGVLSVSFLPF